jgi:hypothetical protein
MKHVIFALLLLCASPVAAQSVHYPGSLMSSTGTLTQTRNLFVSLAQFEQGVATGGFEGLFQFRFASDMSLNRDMTGALGVRYTRARGNRMIRGTLFYVKEIDPEGSRVNAIPKGVVGSIDFWAGWGRAPRYPANRRKE